jgi:penicillin-binding protein 1A
VPIGVRRFLVRLTIGLLSAVVVVALLLVGAGALALNTEWALPSAREVGRPSTLYDRDGTGWYRFVADVERTPVALHDISPNLRDAVVATEDHRFYEHPGVDPLGVVRAVWQNVRSAEVTQGASTLTQQYVKLTFTGAERTLQRKVREAVLAIQIEKDLSKDQILEAYLNRVYFGEGAYGAQAAAIRYFGVAAADLTLAQAAAIASTLGRPADYSPIDDPEGTTSRRDLVLQEMADHGFRTQAEVDAAIAEPLGLAPVGNPAPAAPYLVEEIRRQLLESVGPDLLYRGGLAITATVDLDRQFELERRMIPHLPADPGFEPAAVAIDPRTGDVLAAWSGRDHDASQVDLALVQDYGRPSGSTFKVFALAAALEQGYALTSRWAAPSQVVIGDWRPTGGGCGGSCTLLQATASSVNTVFAQVAREVGTPAMVGMAERMGVRSALRLDDLTQVLGTSSVTALDMASAMGTLANDGVACPARLVLGITDAEGEPVSPPDPRQPDPEDAATWLDRVRAEGWRVEDPPLGRCHRAVAAGVARRTTTALQAVVDAGTGTRADIGRPQAGKTGTTTDSAQVWFTGYTPDLALAVMVSHRDGDVPLRNLPGCGAECYGGRLPATIWADVATGLLEGVPPTPFPEVEPDDRRDADEPVPPRNPAVPRGSRPAPPPAVPAADADDDGTGDAPADDGADPGAPEPDPDPAPPPQDDPPGPDGGIIGDLLGGDGGDGGDAGDGGDGADPG